MAKHRVSSEGRSFFGPRKRDSLFERSFTSCNDCGDDVYVLAEDCRACGAVLNATRQPVHHSQPVSQPVPQPAVAQAHYAQLTRHAQPVQQGHYAQLTRQSQPVPQAQPVAPPQPVRRPQAIHWAQQASQARMAAVRLRAS